MVMGFQNVSQLRSIYGRDRTTTLTSAPTTKVILRCDEAETAEWASEQLGRHEVVRVEMTALAGLSNYREGINLQPHRRVEAIIMGAEVQSLKEYEGYVCVAGADRAKITVPLCHLERRQPDFLPQRRRVPESEGGIDQASQPAKAEDYAVQSPGAPKAEQATRKSRRIPHANRVAPSNDKSGHRRP